MLSIENYKNRRNECIEKMKEISNGNKACMILFSPPERQRNGDTFYDYRFSSDIFFLTGLKDPELTIMIRSEEPNTIAFILPKEPDKEVWTGIRKSNEEIKEKYGIDEVHTITEFDKLYDYLETYDDLFISFIDMEKSISQLPVIINKLNSRKRGNPEIGKEISKLIKENPVLDSNKAGKELIDKMKELKDKRKAGVNYPRSLYDAHSLLSEMRKYKNKEEISTLKKCIEITGEAYKNTIKFTKPGLYERDVKAFHEYQFKKNGGDDTGFLSIVAGGINATILHYVQTDCELKDNSLLLIDSGAEKNGYTADITRTFPIGKKFTPVQKDVYQAVLEVEKKVIEKIRPGISVKELNDFCTKEIITALIDLGVLKGDIETLFLLDSYKPFYMHGVSHFLGLDVHDVGAYYKEVDKPEPLKPGAVITVEPGLYFGKIAKDLTPEKLYGIGIRIEDDILVTENGYENLSSSIPKEIDDIENLK
jgi:Xaa-Pro aminopeptidase